MRYQPVAFDGGLVVQMIIDDNLDIPRAGILGVLEGIDRPARKQERRVVATDETVLSGDIAAADTA